jgi:uncharacterized protein YecT (DUF1311 family)
MIPRFIPPALLLALLAVAARPVQAASFNCAKATKPDEKAICDSTKLSDLDVEMATLYRVRMELPMLMGARGAAQDEQRAFLAQRGNCGASVACLQAAYGRAQPDHQGGDAGLLHEAWHLRLSGRTTAKPRRHLVKMQVSGAACGRASAGQRRRFPAASMTFAPEEFAHERQGWIPRHCP